MALLLKFILQLRFPRYDLGQLSDLEIAEPEDVNSDELLY